MQNTLLGKEKRSRGLKALVGSILGNSYHLWMWDKQSLTHELEEAGFANIRSCKFNDCSDDMFKLVENEERFENAVSIECNK